VQPPKALLGLAVLEPEKKVVLELELAEKAVLVLEEEVEQVVKKVPPSFGNEAIFSRLIVLFFILMDHLRSFPLWLP